MPVLSWGFPPSSLKRRPQSLFFSPPTVCEQVCVLTVDSQGLTGPIWPFGSHSGEYVSYCLF